MDTHRWNRWAVYAVLGAALLCLAMAFCSGCAAMESLGLIPPERVMADPMYVGGDTPSVLTEEPVLDAAGQPTGRNYVIVSESDLPDRAPRIPIADAPTHQPERPWSELAVLLAGAIGGPIAAAGAKVVFTRRGRSAVFPALAEGNVLRAAHGVIKADGWLHSTPPSEPPPAEPKAAS